jgi:hypothetical protein
MSPDSIKQMSRYDLAQFQNNKTVTKGFANKKIAFYNQKKSQMGSRFSASTGGRHLA